MSVTLLQTLSLVAYILAGLCFLIAVALFFYLKVPVLWGEVTGRTARKAIRAMKWKNEEAAPMPISQGATDSGLSAKLAEANQVQAEMTRQEAPEVKERTPLIASEQKPPLKAAPPAEAAIPTEQDTTTEQPCSDLGQTALLPTEEAGLTEVLPTAEPGATELLPRPDIGQTSVLHVPSYQEPLIGSTGELPSLGETTLLDGEQADRRNGASPALFVMEKELAFTDSTEIIE